uniref:Basement membrane-specific heparan sulfate proteoglycan core protein n=1 Tax=Ditylenchus dipsaci TaxID=166011 RepID=A0A915ED04_9BILA
MSNPYMGNSSLGDVSWEIAVQRDTQDVRALEVGTSCEDCAPGYERSGSGPYLGTCVPRRAPPAPQCSSIGAVSVQPSYDGRCQCKQNTVGATCDRCAPGSFHMAPTNPQGCLKCFCSGVANQCDSSGWRRTTVEINYARGAQDRLKPSLRIPEIHSTRGQTLYWKLPAKFLGNKITSYGGNLKYVFRFSGSGNLNTEPDVIIRGNDITLHHTNRNPVQADRDNTVAVPIFEDRWQRSDGQPATREHLLMALADVDDVLIKMSYMSDCSSSSLVSVSLDFAEQYAGGAQALEVEDCQCPIGYVGTPVRTVPRDTPELVEDSIWDYVRNASVMDMPQNVTKSTALVWIASTTLRVTSARGASLALKEMLDGEHRKFICILLFPYFGLDCQQAAAKPPCQCYNHSPRGSPPPPQLYLQLCEHNTEGFHCETCKKGFYGDATRATPYDCTPCPCPGTSECFLDPTGQVQCRNCPAGFAGRLCDECAPGYSRSQASGGRDCEPTGRVHTDHIQFVPTPEVALRVEILPPKHLSIQEGSRAKWTCKPETVTIQWTKIGSTYLPPHAQQRDNQLIIDSVQASDAGQYRCTGTTANDIATDEAS